jgi:multimeric flavodoxin WrbA
MTDARFADNVRQQIQNISNDEGHEVAVFTLKELCVAPCCGYFRCWINSPGTCVIQDTVNKIVDSIVNSDCWVFITNVTFGGYSSELKKVIDRLPPLMLPHFMRVNGEVHHRPRYRKIPNLLVFGYAESEDKESENIFQAIVARNSVNFHMNKAVAKVFLKDKDKNFISQKVREAFDEVGAIS